jgi:hypothetical protein
MHAIKLSILVIVIGIALYILHKFLIWCEKKRWINYRRISSDSIGDAMMEIHTMLSPNVKNVIEIKQQKKQEEDDSGDPPDPQSEDKSLNKIQ